MKNSRVFVAEDGMELVISQVKTSIVFDLNGENKEFIIDRPAFNSRKLFKFIKKDMESFLYELNKR